ncbi:hypothetical protein [Streptomyces sp. NBC_00878]|uniref:hypothetical protein n=1 Tax=Streptomyces sp. NBC_00878 TaxID=2975854 RepID=UPI002256E9A9|nr:hypothetical protein [Streptomyces sp. NBC_00878]MCX4911478.1 hypothetical protein [Streptomyces sp. NBC_00878]
MGDAEFWEELRAGTTGEVVLAIDIPSSGNGMDFRELVPLLDTPHTVWRALEHADAPPGDGSLDAYVTPWVRAVRARGLTVRAVLGHGVGSILASAIAEALGGDGGLTPRVLLFDPELVDADTVVGEFRRVTAEDPHLLSAHDVNTLDLRLDSVVEQSLDDPAALALRLRSVILRADADADADADVADVGARTTTATLNRALSRLSVLALAEPYDVMPLWSRCTALCSSSAGNGLSRTRTALLLPEARFVAQEIFFRDEHEEILKSPAVARTVSVLLAAAPDMATTER